MIYFVILYLLAIPLALFVGAQSHINHAERIQKSGVIKFYMLALIWPFVSVVLTVSALRSIYSMLGTTHMAIDQEDENDRNS